MTHFSGSWLGPLYFLSSSPFTIRWRKSSISLDSLPLLGFDFFGSSAAASPPPPPLASLSSSAETALDKLPCRDFVVGGWLASGSDATGDSSSSLTVGTSRSSLWTGSVARPAENARRRSRLVSTKPAMMPTIRKTAGAASRHMYCAPLASGRENSSPPFSSMPLTIELMPNIGAFFVACSSEYRRRQLLVRAAEEGVDFAVDDGNPSLSLPTRSSAIF
mmetsp:Transcript_14639/g.25791  ORF Transcript_14639/g.25791 Transcript_14639/m.25791 type:complete len:219 (+) Transcript_14639:3179-3835(+)